MSTAIALPEMKTVAPDGSVPDEIPDEIREYIALAKTRTDENPAAWQFMQFDTSDGASEFVKLGKAVCATAVPVLTFRRQTVYMPDPEDDESEVEDGSAVRFRITEKTERGTRARRK